MKLLSACSNILRQLEEVVEQIHPNDFCRPSFTLSQATIGQHLRHTLEFFICLEKGVETGVINYDKREHDKLIESDKFIALSALGRIRDFVCSQQEDRELQLEVDYSRHGEDPVIIATNYYRELNYNIEHAIHHMAIMKIGVREVAPYVKLANHFGVAVSTVRFHEVVEDTPIKR